MRATVLLLLTLATGCAFARQPGQCFAWALGKDSVATCYGEPAPFPTLPVGSQRVEERRQEIDRTFPARDEKRHTTITTPAETALVASSQPIQAQAHGSAISDTFGGILRIIARTAWQAIKAVFGAPVP